MASLLSDDRDVRKESAKITRDVFSGKWDDISDQLTSIIARVLPREIERSVNCDLAKNPGKYLQSTLRMCQLAGEGYKMGFLPTRRGNVPCHAKFDTESIAQLFVESKL